MLSILHYSLRMPRSKVISYLKSIQDTAFFYIIEVTDVEEADLFPILKVRPVIFP